MKWIPEERKKIVGEFFRAVPNEKWPLLIEILHDLEEITIKAVNIYGKMKKSHERYCNYPCFTLVDVFFRLLEEEGFIEPETPDYQGTTVYWRGKWGNTSFEHFWWEFRDTYAEMRK